MSGFKSCPRVGGIFLACKEARPLSGFKSCPRVGGILEVFAFANIPTVSSRAPVWGASGASSLPHLFF